jgi:enoyl-CoA hydratase/carnithine racemase
MEALMDATTEKAQIRITRSSAAYWRVTFDNPPLNVMGPQFVREFREIVTAVEADEGVKELVFESAVEGFFLNHSDFHARATGNGSEIALACDMSFASREKALVTGPLTVFYCE